MAGGKETPRQKMIGMMYLVLTALLALNVSKEILNAFVVMNDSLVATNRNIEDKNSYAFTQFELAKAENEAKAGPWFARAEQVRNKSKEVYNYLENVKAQIIGATDGKEPSSLVGVGADGYDTVVNSSMISGKDNYDVPSHELGLAEPKNPVTMPSGYDALTIEAKIGELRDLMTSTDMIPENKRESSPYQAILNTFAMADGVEHGEPVTWKQQQFYHMPLAACIANISKMQTDVRNAEADMIKFLYSRVDAASFKFNKLESAVIAPTSYLLQGDTFRAKVFLAAFDTTQSPLMTLAPNYVDSAKGTFGADTLGPDNLYIKDGMGIVRVPATTEGIFTLKGLIKIKAPEGGYQSYRVNTSYQVARPSLTVSPTKMNVFYKGVDNPVSISVPGVAADKIRPSISNGSISKSGKDGYIVKVKSGNKAIISVSATMPDGSSKAMGKVEFRVKTVPDPKPYFAGKSTGDDKVKKKQLTAAQGVIAKMENFDFDLKFTVISFKLTMIVGGTPIEKISKSNRVTGDMKTMMKKAKPGSKVYIEAIKARGPDGTVRNLGSLSLKVT